MSDQSEQPAIDEKLAKELAGLSFEEALERLEGIVDDVESGEVDLAASLKRFAEGNALAKRCEEILGKAEQQLKTLAPDDD